MDSRVKAVVERKMVREGLESPFVLMCAASPAVALRFLSRSILALQFPNPPAFFVRTGSLDRLSGKFLTAVV